MGCCTTEWNRSWKLWKVVFTFGELGGLSKTTGPLPQITTRLCKILAHKRSIGRRYATVLHFQNSWHHTCSGSWNDLHKRSQKLKTIYKFHQTEQLLCSTLGEVESMIKFQHEIDVDFPEEMIRVRLISTMRARISPTHSNSWVNVSNVKKIYSSIVKR